MTNYPSTTTIGTTTIESNIFFAPLAGCSDLSFRLLVRTYGAQFAFFEMIDANSILNNNAETMAILASVPEDTPIGAQLLGGDPSLMLDAAQKLLEHTSPVVLDINCGCPVRKVMKKKSGAFLLTDPQSTEQIIRRLASHLTIPITVKIRIGFEQYNKQELISYVKMCENAGAQVIFVHGRTKEQAYAGDINYTAIREIVNNVSVPVFGSGNIFSPELAKKMIDETGCHGVLVARGAFGNPWIFEDIRRYLASGILPEDKSTHTKVETLKQHLAYVDTYNPCKGSGKVGFMRKITQWYLTDFPGVRKLRNSINSITSYEDLLSLLNGIPY